MKGGDEALPDVVERGLSLLGQGGDADDVNTLPAAHAACSKAAAARLEREGVLPRLAAYVDDVDDWSCLGAAVVVLCAAMPEHAYPPHTLRSLVSLVEGAGALPRTPTTCLVVTHVCGGLSAALAAPGPCHLPHDTTAVLLDMLALQQQSHASPAALALLVQCAASDLGWVTPERAGLLRSLLDVCCLPRLHRSMGVSALVRAHLLLQEGLPGVEQLVSSELHACDDAAAKDILQAALQELQRPGGGVQVCECLEGIIEGAASGDLGEGLDALVAFGDVLLMRDVPGVSGARPETGGAKQALAQAVGGLCGALGLRALPAAVMSYILLADSDLAAELVCVSLACSTATEHLSEDRLADLAAFVGLGSPLELPSSLPQVVFHIQQSPQLRFELVRRIFSTPALALVDELPSADIVAVAESLQMVPSFAKSMEGFLRDPCRPAADDLLHLAGVQAVDGGARVAPAEAGGEQASSGRRALPAPTCAVQCSSMPSALLMTIQAGGCPLLSWVSRASLGSTNTYPAPALVAAILDKNAPKPQAGPHPTSFNTSLAQLPAKGKGLLLLLSEAAAPTPSLAVCAKEAVRVPYVALLSLGCSGKLFLRLLWNSRTPRVKKKKPSPGGVAVKTLAAKDTVPTPRRKQTRERPSNGQHTTDDPAVRKDHHHHHRPPSSQSQPRPDSQPARSENVLGAASDKPKATRHELLTVHATGTKKSSTVSPKFKGQDTAAAKPKAPHEARAPSKQSKPEPKQATTKAKSPMCTQSPLAAPVRMGPVGAVRQAKAAGPVGTVRPQGPPRGGATPHPHSHPHPHTEQRHVQPAALVRDMLALEETRIRERVQNLRHVSRAVEGRYDAYMSDLAERCRKDYMAFTSEQLKRDRYMVKRRYDQQGMTPPLPPLPGAVADSSPVDQPKVLPPIAETRKRRSQNTRNPDPNTVALRSGGGGGGGLPGIGPPGSGHAPPSEASNVVTAKHWVSYTTTLKKAILDDFISAETRKLPQGKRGPAGYAGR